MTRIENEFNIQIVISDEYGTISKKCALANWNLLLHLMAFQWIQFNISILLFRIKLQMCVFDLMGVAEMNFSDFIILLLLSLNTTGTITMDSDCLAHLLV